MAGDLALCSAHSGPLGGFRCVVDGMTRPSKTVSIQQRKLAVLLMLVMGAKLNRVARECDVARHSARRWWREFNAV